MSYEDEVFDDVRRRFPKLSRRVARVIARHEVGRVRTVNPPHGNKTDNIVSAYIRHTLTNYDHSLKSYGLTKQQARDNVQDQVQQYLAAWR